MEHIRLGRLKATLIDRGLTARELAAYLAAHAALMSIALIPSPGEGPVGWTFLAYPLIAVAGVFYCYRCNGGADAARFAERYLSLAWVITLRTLIALIALLPLAAVAAVLVDPERGHLDSPGLAIAIDIGSLVVTSLIYWRTGVHIRDVRRAESAHALPSA